MTEKSEKRAAGEILAKEFLRASGECLCAYDDMIAAANRMSRQAPPEIGGDVFADMERIMKERRALHQKEHDTLQRAINALDQLTKGD